jgi:hypothetical protein
LAAKAGERLIDRSSTSQMQQGFRRQGALVQL